MPSQEESERPLVWTLANESLYSPPQKDYFPLPPHFKADLLAQLPTSPMSLGLV